VKIKLGYGNYNTDLRESKSDWNLYIEGVKQLNKCDNCKNYFNILGVKCRCNDV